MNTITPKLLKQFRNDYKKDYIHSSTYLTISKPYIRSCLSAGYAVLSW